jgi:hypothetical protein
VAEQAVDADAGEEEVDLAISVEAGRGDAEARADVEETEGLGGVL